MKTLEDLGMVKKGNLYYSDYKHCLGEWKFVAETGEEWKDDFDEPESCGISIYQSQDIPTVALREYGDYGNAIMAPDYFVGHFEEKNFLEKLQKIQSKVSLTQFPYGVMTINDIIVGQIIPYFPETMTLDQGLKSNKIKNLEIYKNALTILKELYDNGVIYLDTHSKNFLIKDGSKMPILIDFDPKFVCFKGESTQYIQSTFFNHFAKLTNNGLYYMGYGLENFKPVFNFDSAYEQLDDLDKKLIKKK